MITVYLLQIPDMRGEVLLETLQFTHEETNNLRHFVTEMCEVRYSYTNKCDTVPKAKYVFHGTSTYSYVYCC